MIRTAIVARSELERAGLGTLLASDADIDVVARVALTDIPDLTPEADVIVIATDAPLDESVLRLAQNATILLIVDDPDAAKIAHAFRAGIRGVAGRQSGSGELAAAVRAVHQGWAVCAPADLLAVLPPERNVDQVAEPLTPRELDVLRMIADGLGNKQVAFQLGISEHTVKFHVNSILQKLGASSRTEAVMLGLRSGLILL